MSRFIDSLGWTLIHFAWQGAVVAALAALAFAILRNSRPRLRYLIGCAALLACVAWPALEFFGRWHAYVRYADAASQGDIAALFVVAATADLVREHMGVVVAVWCAGALGFALRMGAGLLWVRRLAAAGTEEVAALRQRFDRLAAMAGIEGKVGLKVHEGLAGGPLAIGFLRPVVIVPVSLASGMPPHLLDALLAHELGHIRHHDYLVNLLQHVVETLLFYHPAVWWLSSRVRAEREHMADDFAALLVGDPRQVAFALSELEKSHFSTMPLAQAASAGNLAERVRRLVMPQTDGIHIAALAPVVGALLAGVAFYANAAVSVAGADREPHVVFQSCQKPMYPQSALDNGATGTVNLGFRVSADGRVLSSRVVRSSGHQELDQAARSALERCRFEPGLQRGRPVEMNARIQYIWLLE